MTPALSHHEIANEAESLWRSQGFPVGRDQDIWLQAERSLLERQKQQRNARDRAALADPRFAFNKKSGHIMDELKALFPNPEAGQVETTSL